MSFPRYPKYKDSGMEWLGEVPEHWGVAPMKRIVRAQSGTDTKSDSGEIPLYGANGIIGQAETASQINGALLVGRVGSAGSITFVSEPCAVSDNALIVRHTVLASSRYLFYLLTSLNLTAEISKNAQPLITGTALLGKTVAYSISYDEQAQIAVFLDRETTKIDELVAEQRRLMELLKEKRQAVISHAVTQGLNPNAPMKPSGIEWLGDVPVHWEVRKLKFLCDVQTGDKDTENAVEDGLYPFFVRSQTVERINSTAFDCEAILTAGDGVGVGKVFHYHNGPFDFHQRVYMMNNFREVSGPYLFHFFRENFYKVALEGGAKSTVDSLRRPVFMNFTVCVPPKAEQAAIVTSLEREAGKFDTLTAEAQRAIDLLQERRTALISAAVTGQIDVRAFTEREAA